MGTDSRIISLVWASFHEIGDGPNGGYVAMTVRQPDLKFQFDCDSALVEQLPIHEVIQRKVCSTFRKQIICMTYHPKLECCPEERENSKHSLNWSQKSSNRQNDRTMRMREKSSNKNDKPTNPIQKERVKMRERQPVGLTERSLDWYTFDRTGWHWRVKKDYTTLYASINIPQMMT